MHPSPGPKVNNVRQYDGAQVVVTFSDGHLLHLTGRPDSRPWGDADPALQSVELWRDEVQVASVGNINAIALARGYSSQVLEAYMHAAQRHIQDHYFELPEHNDDRPPHLEFVWNALTQLWLDRNALQMSRHTAQLSTAPSLVRLMQWGGGQGFCREGLN